MSILLRALIFFEAQMIINIIDKVIKHLEEYKINTLKINDSEKGRADSCVCILPERKSFMNLILKGYCHTMLDIYETANISPQFGDLRSRQAMALNLFVPLIEERITHFFCGQKIENWTLNGESEISLQIDRRKKGIFIDVIYLDELNQNYQTKIDETTKDGSFMYIVFPKFRHQVTSLVENLIRDTYTDKVSILYVDDIVNGILSGNYSKKLKEHYTEFRRKYLEIF